MHPLKKHDERVILLDYEYGYNIRQMVRNSRDVAIRVRGITAITYSKKTNLINETPRIKRLAGFILEDINNIYNGVETIEQCMEHKRYMRTLKSLQNYYSYLEKIKSYDGNYIDYNKLNKQLLILVENNEKSLKIDTRDISE